MKKIFLLIFLTANTLTFSTKYLVPSLKKDNKQLVIHLKAREIDYKIKKGDTLDSIAKKYQMTVEELKRRNNLNSDKDLIIGKIISVDSVDKNADNKKDI
ncbi:LysM peptidoglycan-binding domain-containing protein [Fusobacterium perfoetens]|uniref:LysM peptidoglycan-binding domain-containing protein n=1 Tax=Fusobacterium perfoetens TaxID=852 RepID=UPI000481976D|nr:LysM domain-containing protein [Fusobacterium perfoetens]MCI6152129.1 LysM peptidoglycan-binding domain-containing protein [Fusobacterium perfoetens]MDY3237980.1 LysM peptidoglycan-binding domain-containing protein [Fusobacterium perfoetens]